MYIALIELQGCVFDLEFEENCLLLLRGIHSKVTHGESDSILSVKPNCLSL